MNKININPDLTSKSAREFRLEWVSDQPIKETKNQTLNSELFLGHPKNQSETHVGIYKKIKLLPVDSSLTPENAKNRGYEWTKDVIYDPEAPEEAMGDLFRSLDEGFIFGEPANINTKQNGFIGLYRKIQQK